MLARRKPLKAKTALKRGNALRTKAILKRATPLKATGKRHARRKSFMALCRAAVMRRAGVVIRVIDGEPMYIRCEECQAVTLVEEAHWHHVLGRTLGVDSGRSRWVHVKELTLALCPACHELVTNPPDERAQVMRTRQERLAAIRLGARLGVGRPAAILGLNKMEPRLFVRFMLEIPGIGQPSEP